MYEIAQASLEMKLLYGHSTFTGFGLTSTVGVAEDAVLRQRMRAQILAASPVVVALLLCPQVEAERYRAGLETFIDRVFFQEEVEECLTFLRAAVRQP